MLGFRDSDVDMNQLFKIHVVGGHAVFVLGVFVMHRDAHICFVVAGVSGDFIFQILLGAHAPCFGPYCTAEPRFGSMRHWCHRQLQQPYVGHPTLQDSSQLSAMDVGAGSVCVVISERTL